MNKKKPYRAPNAQCVDLDDPLMALRFSETRVFKKGGNELQLQDKMDVIEGNPKEIYAKPHSLWEEDE